LQVKNFRIFVLALFILAVTSCFANLAFADDETPKHPIDAGLEERIDADPSTAGMIESCQWAEGEWDKLLNENYQALMKKLDKKDQDRLRASQREWVKFRDLEFAFNGNFYGGMDGTMFRTIAAGDRTDFVRERALKLGSYLNSLEL
jgi:uncharacterized protein YecT (DUF1311 family)